MAVPKRRTSKAKQGTRRSHHHLTAKGVQLCANCNNPVLPHRVCENCGFYQGRAAVAVKDDQSQGA